MTARIPLCAVLIAAALLQAPASAAVRERGVDPDWVGAHVKFLAGDALQGRGSATRDEAIAAAYVAAQFEGIGLEPAPGASGYTQTARIVRPRLDGRPQLTVGGELLSPTLLSASGNVRGRLAVLSSADPADMPEAEVVVVAHPSAPLGAMQQAAAAKNVKLLLRRESIGSWRNFSARGNRTLIDPYLEANGPRPATAIAMLPDAEIDALAAKAGAEVSLALPLVRDIVETTNAVGYLPGTDPDAGVLLISAHLDHEGIVNGTLMPGANDNASGTAAVIELARALAAGKRPRRGILFAAYGSEEFGGLGSTHFAANAPVPLPSIVANLSIEMIGQQDPKLPQGSLMMTGFERSTLGETLRRNGALLAPDPYPEQNFFERSDNYSLARRGIVAHTVSGWAMTPTYHQPTDTVASIDIAFMTRAIGSLVEPLRRLADSNATPQWRPGGRRQAD